MPNNPTIPIPTWAQHMAVYIPIFAAVVLGAFVILDGRYVRSDEYQSLENAKAGRVNQLSDDVVKIRNDIEWLVRIEAQKQRQGAP